MMKRLSVVAALLLLAACGSGGGFGLPDFGVVHVSTGEEAT
jgi:predicted small lipoprotein YifL